MLGLVVVSKLDLTLVAGELAGLVKGDGVGSVQDVVTGLARLGHVTCVHVRVHVRVHRPARRAG